MIALAAAFGGLSPFCSCGVIPLNAALLSMSVPLSADQHGLERLDLGQFRIGLHQWLNAPAR